MSKNKFEKNDSNLNSGEEEKRKQLLLSKEIIFKTQN